MKLHNEDWRSHLPWIKQWVAMRKELGATCLNCEWDFHVFNDGRKVWGVLTKACPEHQVETAPQTDAPTIQ